MNISGFKRKKISRDQVKGLACLKDLVHKEYSSIGDTKSTEWNKLYDFYYFLMDFVLYSEGSIFLCGEIENQEYYVYYGPKLAIIVNEIGANFEYIKLSDIKILTERLIRQKVAQERDLF